MVNSLSKKVHRIYFSTNLSQNNPTFVIEVFVSFDTKLIPWFRWGSVHSRFKKTQCQISIVKYNDIQGFLLTSEKGYHCMVRIIKVIVFSPFISFYVTWSLTEL